MPAAMEREGLLLQEVLLSPFWGEPPVELCHTAGDMDPESKEFWDCKGSAVMHARERSVASARGVEHAPSAQSV